MGSSFWNLLTWLENCRRNIVPTFYPLSRGKRPLSCVRQPPDWYHILRRRQSTWIRGPNSFERAVGVDSSRTPSLVLGTCRSQKFVTLDFGAGRTSAHVLNSRNGLDLLFVRTAAYTECLQLGL